MKTLFVATLFTFFLSPSFAQLSPPLPSVVAPVCAEKVLVADSLEGILGGGQAFCAGTCERDFDCMPGCSCHMSGRCM